MLLRLHKNNAPTIEFSLKKCIFLLICTDCSNQYTSSRKIQRVIADLWEGRRTFRAFCYLLSKPFPLTRARRRLRLIGGGRVDPEAVHFLDLRFERFGDEPVLFDRVETAELGRLDGDLVHCAATAFFRENVKRMFRRAVADLISI